MTCFNTVNSGEVDGRIELADMLRKRRYPKGNRAIANLAEYFDKRIVILYKMAPPLWRKGYMKAVFGGIERYRSGQGLIESGKWQRGLVDRERKAAKHAKRQKS